MKNLSLFLTLGVVTLMGACNKVNSETPVNEEPTANSSVILESAEEPTAEGFNVELEESTLEAQAEEELPIVDGEAVEGALEDATISAEEILEDTTIGAEESLEDTTIGVGEDAEIEASEINPDANGDIILPATDNAEIPTEEEAAEAIEPAE